MSELAPARDKSLALWAIIDEAVLRRPVGGREIMHGQLLRLAEAARQTNVTPEVLPFSVGAHIAMLGTFVLCPSPNPNVRAPYFLIQAALPDLLASQ